MEKTLLDNHCALVSALKRGEKKGIEKGEKEGERKKSIEIAGKLLSEG